jgi:signal peptidase II
MKGVLKYFLISLTVIVVDHAVKLLVHFNMVKGPSGEISIFGNWFKLHYLTNPGMAFGMELPFDNSKIFLTLFRIFAMVAIGLYLTYLYKKQASHGLLICIGLILGGAIGNLIDSVFYGVFLDNAPFDAPSPWFYGQVVDMFYFDIWEGYLPEWLPFWGGKFMALWPVFNIADASIFVSICIILIFQKRFFKTEEESKEESTAETIASE